MVPLSGNVLSMNAIAMSTPYGSLSARKMIPMMNSWGSFAELQLPSMVVLTRFSNWELFQACRSL